MQNNNIAFIQAAKIRHQKSQGDSAMRIYWTARYKMPHKILIPSRRDIFTLRPANGTRGARTFSVTGTIRMHSYFNIILHMASIIQSRGSEAFLNLKIGTKYFKKFESFLLIEFDKIYQIT